MILDKNISLPAHIMFQEFDDEAILLDIRTQEHFGLNPIANEFLKSIHQGSTPRDAFSFILESYDVKKEDLEKDLEFLLNNLVQHQLIEVT